METIINPYTYIGTQHKDALDVIINNLPPQPTFEQLQEQLIAAFIPPTPEIPVPVNLVNNYTATILPLAYNGYVNALKGHYLNYTEAQLALISTMLNGVEQTLALLIDDYLTDTENSLAQSNLGYAGQMPLLLSVALGRASYQYWMNQFTNPTVWTDYLDSNIAVNYMLLPDLVSATMRGALLTYGIMQHPQIQVLDLYTALIGSTGLAAGKVLFGWRVKT